MKTRKCIGCGSYKDASEMMKITKNFLNNDVILNPNSKIFGRSAYLCYNDECVELALKKNKLNKALKTSRDLKGILDGKH